MVINGVEIDSEIVAYTLRNDYLLIIQTRTTEYAIADAQLSDLEYLNQLIADENRADFEGWYFVKKFVTHWDVSVFGIVTIQTDYNRCEFEIPSSRVEEAREFLQSEFSVK